MKGNICFHLAILCLSVALQPIYAGIISVSGPLTDDTSTGIDVANAYTHAISGGGAESVNGVDFDLIDSGNLPANTDWEVSSVKNQINDNNGGWDPVAGGVTGIGLQGLLGSFTFNNDGLAGSNQTFTLSGLTPGQTYDFRLYCRKWDDSTERTQDVTFTAGSEAPDTITFAEDRPENAPISQPNRENAYYVSYLYTADAAGTLAVRFEITAGAAGPGSFHMYGMSNQVASSYQISAAPLLFASTVTQGDLVSELTGSELGVPEPSTFELVAGDGDDDNGLFQIAGQELQAGAFDFSTDPDGTEYMVRVRGTGTIGGGTAEIALVLTLTRDSDADDLPDAWELTWALDLTELSGLGGADFDMDGLSDLEEFQISTTSYPAINPKLADSDSDNLEDGAEIAGADVRPPTDPTAADTDGDGLDDEAETNTGVFISVSDTGSDPTDNESDGDGFEDGVEVAAGSDPNDPASIPPLPGGFAVVGPITDLESSGISSEDTYTHAISGGGLESVGGVTFDLIDSGNLPANTDWVVSSVKNQINDNNGGWDVGASGVTDPELLGLLGSFTFNNDGAAGSNQTFTLSGLTPGQSYETRLYMRKWDNSTARGQTVSFTAGAAQTDSLTFFEDHPELAPINMPSRDSAWYLSYTYAADAAGTLDIGFEVQDSGPVQGAPGSFHMYGLTNRVASPPIEFKITNITYTAGENPTASITFNSRPGATYGIFASTSMKATGVFPGGWIELDDSYPSEGGTTTYVDSIVAGSAPRVFYQVRESTN